MNAPAQTVLALARAGNIPAAIERGEALIGEGHADSGLTMFVGILCCRNGDLTRGIVHLHAAVALAPGQPLPRAELARALLSAGRYAEAADQATALEAIAAGPEAPRIRALALLRSGEAEAAEVVFEQLVARDAGDFEAWAGLGRARLARGAAAEAIAALDHATRLKPGIAANYALLAKARGMTGDANGALDAARAAVRAAPTEAEGHIECARASAALRNLPGVWRHLADARAMLAGHAEDHCDLGDIAVAAKRLDLAEADYRAALAVDQRCGRAWAGLANVMERGNRPADVHALAAAATDAGVDPAHTAVALARTLRDEGRYNEALAAARLIPDSDDLVAREQVIGDTLDRMGDAEAAFAAFRRSNARLSELNVGSRDHAEEYRAGFDRLSRLISPEWYARWHPAPASGDRRAPLFLFGFPRSGTTLIDTMLGGHPDAVVLEEEASVDRLAEAMGPLDHLGQIDDREIERLRAVYFAEVDRIVPDAGQRLIVDKQPLALGSTPTLHRIFPDARFLFAERHPCDVVLSCFITSAQMDAKVANFFDFEATARLYDSVLTFWTRCTQVLDMAWMATRYERLIADPAAELRAVAAFAGLDWRPELADNRRHAAERRFIASPSYAQVAQPIYKRAEGRWRRYRRQMEPVLPILAPWVERMGYSLD